MNTPITDFLKDYPLSNFISEEVEGNITYRNFKFIRQPNNHWAVYLQKQQIPLCGTLTNLEVARMIVTDHITCELRRHFNYAK